MLLSFILGGAAAPAAAAVPQRVTYQGNLRESGVLVTGTKSMSFSLYDAPLGGTLLWDSGAAPVTVSTGVFRVVLAPAGVDWESALWLQATVEGTPLTPREELTAAPYAVDALLHSGKRYASAAAAPAAPGPGDLWFDTGAGLLKFWSGAAWVPTVGVAGGAADKVSKAGDGMSGPLTLAGSTLTITGQDASGYSLRLSSGLSAPQGTVNAALFVGSGAGLTGITAAGVPGGAAGQVQYNAGGVLGGAAQLSYDAATGRLGLGTAAPQSALELVNPAGTRMGFDVNGSVIELKANGTVLLKIKP